MSADSPDNQASADYAFQNSEGPLHLGRRVVVGETDSDHAGILVQAQVTHGLDSIVVP